MGQERSRATNSMTRWIRTVPTTGRVRTAHQSTVTADSRQLSEHVPPRSNCCHKPHDEGRMGRAAPRVENLECLQAQARRVGPRLAEWRRAQFRRSRRSLKRPPDTACHSDNLPTRIAIAISSAFY